jgi:hypothetical protein
MIDLGKWLIAIASVWLTTACATYSAAPTASEVLSELSRRSGVAELNLQRMLSSCSADQQSLYFCVYRDCVAADLELDRAIAQRAQRVPACEATLPVTVALFRRTRDRACAEGAREDYEGGSMEQTAQALCVAAQTRDMIERSQHSPCVR